MKRYIINFESSEVLMQDQVKSNKDRTSYLKKAHQELGGKLIDGPYYSLGTNRGFLIVEYEDTETLHVFLHSHTMTSNVKFLSVEQIISFEENAELYKKHAGLLTQFKMPGQEEE